MQSPAEFWPTLKREVVTAWSSGQRQEAFLRLGGVAKSLTPPDRGAPPDAPPRWLTDDVDDAPWGGPANVGWLMTAFAILGGALGLRADQLDLALTRATRASARAGTTPRAFAADFEYTAVGRRTDPLRELLLARVTRTLRDLDAPRAEAALSALLALYPDAVGDTSWLALEMAAMDTVNARMHARDEATATALTHAVSHALDAQPDVVRRRATGLLALRGSLQVWRAEARFGGPEHDEAQRALEIAAAVYDALPGFVDLPRAQIPLLRGVDAQRANRPEAAARHLADALVYLVERYRSASPLLIPCIEGLARASLASPAASIDVASTALTRAHLALRGRDEPWAVGALGRLTIELARVAGACVHVGRAGEARALLATIHAQLCEPRLVGDPAATACWIVGEIHARLDEPLAACGCYHAALAHLGGARLADEEFYLTLTRGYATSLARSRNLDGLERMLRDERSFFGDAKTGGAAVLRRWIDAMRATLEAEAREADAKGTAARDLAARLRHLASGLDGGGEPTPAQAEALADPWLAPISPESPAGAAATQDPNYERVVAAIAHLDSPSATDADRARVWVEVIKHGSALLGETSKDLTIAAYVAHAMSRREGGLGLVRGLALLVGLVERYWEVMFPELKRAKRRANALAWYVERTTDAIEQGFVSGGDRESIDQALALVQRLSGASRERLGDAAPRFGPLRETLQRRAFDLAEAPR